MTDRRLLLVHAHPDDESIVTGATMAKYAAEGAAVTLVTCTLGEEGEIIPPDLAHLGPDREDTLGEHRIGELDKACVALGVRDHRFLGGPGRYRDSGMMGAPTNDRPGCFWRADVEEAAHTLAMVIREVRPDVIVTYDDNGGYGHPDHIQAHRVTLRAFEKAAERALPGTPWQTRKLYAIAQPRSVLEESVARLAEAPGPFTAPAAVEDISPATPDHLVTARIDGTAHWPAKALAMRAHATQITVEGELFALSNGIAQEIRAVEYFTLVRGSAPRPGPDGYETDLFA
ncbi:N-acetyl-1-D-myo-inositol-2-amino-2-deoxy-alpha-D-glucopyranoside deacetylase [Streptomonospora nanhaiensis]|uniref:1D-myo-inositol 2-acetamido-2-deoxy-alpha-D-glucopyranoside deacetylase n=1 Tax=Streptomonospora nanhaiensis TaxID=1323731 RepID=A0A853BT22_9ACTN|nr:N-acetyl-1-D-myo-inositol-2-amino-2-deoxy-alpha-D-glucopyranoside deacetylase [Streptomonospora nanhaiensis]MBV2362780.1 N-acetyl-1-D-myo-inositol-2-amino-2-deoxy-alpha-D-glucopyranoside deacetylase [Streptomonospora nanhaiensis]MBX9388761.1 N-acetyl-1-D-myo-inositol-2-amino-2-deoxy-alpha-D-glucopyranoside deacetylase [Streptomonospora nanhaiensis]NYI97866.1 N-acetyl-1-D-myo-inositol-2-amino-2-deoxy-alpha-D-glucopyranoside deacetylase [Streptomonospora nanhaiensis]